MNRHHETMTIEEEENEMIRGHCVFKGYWNDEEKTRETIDMDGWLHTGDIGMWLPNGCLKIIDRKKNIFKTSQGEYIAPERIENILVTSPWVQMAFVTGDSLMSFVVAIIVPKVETVMEYANSHGWTGDLVELCNKKEIISHIRYELELYCKSRELKGFEIPHKIFIDPSPFTVENELLTPTMKLKRFELGSYYKLQIQNLYK
jgi:long-chain acyl-CoA synthetase